MRLVRKLRLAFTIESCTDEIHSQLISFSSVPIPFAHNFESCYSGIDIFNDNAFFRQHVIKSLLLRRQWVIFTLLVRNPTVCVLRQES